MKEKHGKILKTVLNAFLYFLLICSILLAAAMTISKIAGKPLFLFGKSMVWITTSSMKGEFDEQTFILVEKADASSVETGDVIMFRSTDPTVPANNGGYVTHRIHEITEDGKIISKGDAVPGPDNYPVEPGNIVGKYVGTLPVMTALMRFFSTGLGLVLLFLILGGLCAGLFVPDLIKKNKRKKEERLNKDELKEKLIAEEIEKLKKENGKENADQSEKSGE